MKVDSVFLVVVFVFKNKYLFGSIGMGIKFVLGNLVGIVIVYYVWLVNDFFWGNMFVFVFECVGNELINLYVYVYFYVLIKYFKYYYNCCLFK